MSDSSTQSLTMDSRRNNNPFNQDTCDKLPRPRKSLSIIDLSPNVTSYDQTGLRSAMSRQNADHTLFHDRAQVQQWVANSATGSIPAVDNSYPIFSGNCQEDLFCDVPGTESIFSGSSAAVPSNSLFFLSGGNGLLEQDYELDALAGNVCAIYPTDPVFSDDGHSTGDKVTFEAWTNAESQAYGLPTSAEMMYTVSSDSSHLIDDTYNDAQGWNDFSGSLHDGYVQPCVPISQSTWSSPSTNPLEPSLASSYSQGSQVSGQLGSPTSLNSCEDLSSCASNIEDPVLSPLSLGGSARNGLVPAAYNNMHFDASRFVFFRLRALRI